MEHISQQFDQLLAPLEQLSSLCRKLPSGEKKNALEKQIALIKEQNEQAKLEAYQLIKNPV
ncbi:hypothetical protein [Agarivorans sp. Toyoura001]|uniref:hypothetical protein n=1 Tax=unclassified Agarivorans TaxID=2636026 RepID=UPI0010D1A75E|nr:hypothetical protein [Agarivorans sp. Toyoura001]GDY27595.1 hypothetical protein AHAT_34850 [Agarivorans sp. Toyoura001]